MWHSCWLLFKLWQWIDEMSDLTVNATDIKCRVYVANFMCSVFMSPWQNCSFYVSVEPTFLPELVRYCLCVGSALWNAAGECPFRLQIMHLQKLVLFSSTFFFHQILWMQMFTYICLYCLNSTAGLPAVQLLSVSHILFPFFHSQSFFFLYFLTYFRFTHFNPKWLMLHSLGVKPKPCVATAWAAGTLQEC